MESCLLSYVFLLLCIFIATSVLMIRVFWPKPDVGGSLPPGTTGWPVIGESFDYLKKGWNGKPQEFIQERMAKFSPQAFKTSLLGANTIVLCGPAGNKFMFSNENKLVTTWWPASIDKIFLSSTTQTSSNDEMKKMRKFLPRVLRAEALHGYVGIMDSIARRHLDSNWANRDELTVFPLAKMYTFWLACRLFMSVEDPDQVAKFSKPFERIASGIFSIPIDIPGTTFNKAVKASDQIRRDLLTIIKQRKIDLAENKASPTQDILSHMLLTADEDGTFMHEIGVADKILGLLVGGHDTASITITFIVKYLAELPDIYAKVVQEQTEIAKSKAEGELLNWEDMQKMKYSWNVACEVMRLNPPVQGAFRQAMVGFTYSGFSIPKGWKLYWSTHSTHRNPKYYPDPDTFNPSRFDGSGPEPYTYVPFGGGPRMCPGKEYARLEILAFMHNLVTRFKWEKVILDDKIVVDPMPVPENGLPIRIYPLKP